MILRHFRVPPFVLNNTCTETNGYFGCRGTYDRDDKLQNYGKYVIILSVPEKGLIEKANHNISYMVPLLGKVNIQSKSDKWAKYRLQMA
jgi:hypothetical protein